MGADGPLAPADCCFCPVLSVALDTLAAGLQEESSDHRVVSCWYVGNSGRGPCSQEARGGDPMRGVRAHREARGRSLGVEACPWYLNTSRVATAGPGRHSLLSLLLRVGRRPTLYSCFWSPSGNGACGPFGLLSPPHVSRVTFQAWVAAALPPEVSWAPWLPLLFVHHRAS